MDLTLTLDTGFEYTYLQVSELWMLIQFVLNMHSRNLEWKGRTNNGTDQPDRAFIVTIFDIQHTLKYTRVYNTNWHIIIIINPLHLLEWLSCTKLEKKNWRLPRHFSQKHVQALHEGAFAWLQMYFARGQVHFKLIRIRIRTTECIGRGSLFP